MRPSLRDSWEMQLETLILGSQAPGAFQEDWPYFLPCWSVGFSLSSWLKWFSVLTTKQLEQNPEYFKKHIFCISGKTDSRAVFHINHKTATEAHKHVSFTLKPHTELEFTDVLTSLPYYRHWARALISPPSTRPVKARQCLSDAWRPSVTRAQSGYVWWRRDLISHLMLKNSLLSHLPPEVICSVLVITFQAFIFPDFSHAHRGVRPSASNFDKHLSWAPAYLPQLCGFRLLCPWAICHTSPTLPLASYLGPAWRLCGVWAGVRPLPQQREHGTCVLQTS